jgi:hypothetical protein
MTSTTDNRQTSISPAGFELANPAGERPQTQPLECAATTSVQCTMTYWTNVGVVWCRFCNLSVFGSIICVSLLIAWKIRRTRIIYCYVAKTSLYCRPVSVIGLHVIQACMWCRPVSIIGLHVIQGCMWWGPVSIIGLHLIQACMWWGPVSIIGLRVIQACM